MNHKQPTRISDEMIARYIDGTASREDIALILSRIPHDDELAEMLEILTAPDIVSEKRPFHLRFLPLTRLAAANDKNSCSWDCEIHILKKRGAQFDSWSLLQVAKVNNWLRSAGTPLHNVGRVLESQGLAVNRKYNATVTDLDNAIRSGADVIAVIDRNITAGGSPASIPAYHAVIVKGIGSTPTVTYHDPADYIDVTVSRDKFAEAWAPSRNYMVTAAVGDAYDPHPIKVDDVRLPADLEELVEAIAENAHDVWARERIDEGWRFGPERNDREKTHPDLVEYCRLPEGEKEYDRIMAMNTLRLIQSMGFEITDFRDGLECPDCGNFNHPDYRFCPRCGTKLK